MKIASLHTGHNSTVAYFEDGEIKHCISEERLSRVKNQGGFPRFSLGHVLGVAETPPADLDSLVICGTHPTTQFFFETNSSRSLLRKLKDSIVSLEMDSELARKLSAVYRRYFGFHRNVDKKRAEMDKKIAADLSLDAKKIRHFDHHLCHAATVYYGLCDLAKKWLIFTVDGGGDELSMTISLGENGRISRLYYTPVEYSLGCFYSAITEYLGMKPLEHEYKVMGLAPYAHPHIIEKTYKILKGLLWFDKNSMQIRSRIRNPLYYRFIRRKLEKHRFDQIAGAMQKITEEILREMVVSAIEKTGIRNIALSGGVFMNVKANMLLSNLPSVEDVEIFPSCGDESLPIGGAYLGAIGLGFSPFEIKKIKSIYFGPAYTNEQIKKAIDSDEASRSYKVTYFKDIDKEVARFLAENKIVARFSARAEWGARALGNRSILANAKNIENIRIINEQIKGRDFWMPFAASILREKGSDYLINLKKLPAPYMINAFETKPLAREHLKAGIHPYDFTCRPQLVDKEYNEEYYNLLKHYESMTGMGGLLNTSFNLHGDPLVNSPEDALYTFRNSGLQYLAMGNYLIEKT